ncbi:MAG TPA: NADP oxidoreductase [Aquabacterium sp.]|uniref:NADH-quinone oxidoreductase subunit B family protein n=1 Tax=Aquabacterium sp. TaxID=1872578 RepID=UPI002E3354BA|nr:NADP oxidoreductase [Aquabacterium sp.]HEX5356882.1 NADP oxidoreductase [Aquabacterium sp.]
MSADQQETSKKLRIATCSLAGCFGCHMSFLDVDEALADLIDHIEFDRSPLTDIKHVSEHGVDIGLIEGGLCNSENVETLHEFRQRCKVLVAVGACAMYGGVPALRNGIPVSELVAEAYLGADLYNPQVPQDPELPPLLKKVLPLHEVVAIDYTLAGCPPPAEAFRELIMAMLEGRPPVLPAENRRFD